MRPYHSSPVSQKLTLRLQLEQERQRAANMAEYPRSLGIDPNNLPQ